MTFGKSLIFLLLFAILTPTLGQADRRSVPSTPLAKKWDCALTLSGQFDWPEYIHAVAVHGESLAFLREDMLARLKGMTAEDTAMLLEAIRNWRPHSQKVRRYDLPQDQWLPSRKALDFMANALVPAKKTILEAIEEGQPFMKAWGTYMAKMRMIAGEKGPSYGPSEAMASMRSLQQWLGSIPSGNSRLREAIVLGSFPKGSADLNVSDMDIYLERHKIMQILNLGDLAFSDAVTETVAKPFRKLLKKRTVRYSQVSDRVFDWMRVPSPVFIRVNPVFIDVLFLDATARIQSATEALQMRFMNEKWQNLGVKPIGEILGF
jgi:hypothetical protein